ncbi:unnamed protein product, partial [marine sediment metagenome]
MWNNDNSTIDITYSNVQNGWPGLGNIDLDPLFVDPDGMDGIPATEDDNLRLLADSPCIDAADNVAVPDDVFDLDSDGITDEPIPLDLDGTLRFVDDPNTNDTGNGTPPIVDMGAYEFQAAILNNPPLQPNISGISLGVTGVGYTYTAVTTDPDDDEICYFVDWGDDTNSGWSDFVESGTEITYKHTWSEKGTYTIKAKAKDEYGLEGDWGELEVSMPRSHISIFPR